MVERIRYFSDALIHYLNQKLKIGEFCTEAIEVITAQHFYIILSAGFYECIVFGINPRLVFIF